MKSRSSGPGDPLKMYVAYGVLMATFLRAARWKQVLHMPVKRGVMARLTTGVMTTKTVVTSYMSEHVALMRYCPGR